MNFQDHLNGFSKMRDETRSSSSGNRSHSSRSCGNRPISHAATNKPRADHNIDQKYHDFLNGVKETNKQPTQQRRRARYATGGHVNDHRQAKKLERMGRNGDTQLVHVNKQEERMLKNAGGRGSVNPKTGLREYMFRGMGKHALKTLIPFFAYGAYQDQKADNRRKTQQILLDKALEQSKLPEQYQDLIREKAKKTILETKDPEGTINTSKISDHIFNPALKAAINILPHYNNEIMPYGSVYPEEKSYVYKVDNPYETYKSLDKTIKKLSQQHDARRQSEVSNNNAYNSSFFNLPLEERLEEIRKINNSKEKN